MLHGFLMKKKFPQTKKEIIKKQQIERKQETENTFWNWYSDDLRNWQNTTWMRIQSGQLAEELFEKWKPLLDIFAAEVKGKKIK